MGWSKISLHAKGLYTWPNPLVEIPEGGLVVAQNVVIDRESTTEPRRGYSELDYPLGLDANNRADQIMTFGPNDLVCHYGLPGLPNRLAFFSRPVETTGTITFGSNVVVNLPLLSGLYVDQIVKPIPRETVFLGDQVLGSNTIINLLSSQGLYAGLEVGGHGIPYGTTILTVTGTGPFTLTLSNNALYTQTGNTLTATDSNISGIPDGTRITSVLPGQITLSNNCTDNSRFLNFAPANVDAGLNTININNHGFVDGDSVQFTSTNTLPAPLNSSTIYYIVSSNSVSFQVALTKGGTAINLTDQGTPPSAVHSIIHRTDFTCAGWIDYPGLFYKPQDNVKMRYAEANASLYVTTDEGIKVLDNIEGISFTGDVTFGSAVITNVDFLDVTIGEFVSGAGIPAGAYVTNLLSANSFQISATATLTAAGQKIFVQPRLAGIVPALDGDATLTTDTTGFFEPLTVINYKVVWTYQNANNRIYKGAPSSPIVVVNSTSEYKNVELRFTVPKEITPGYNYQIYRTSFSSAITVDNPTPTPSQDYALIYETAPTYAEIVGQLVTFHDNVPETLRTGAALYTNQSVDGSLAGNYAPPFATDVAAFKDSLFFSNTKTREVLTLTMNSVSGQFSFISNIFYNAGDPNNALKSRILSSPTLVITANTTSGSDIITSISAVNMAATAVGMSIAGAGIPTGTKIAGFQSSTSLRLTKAATATAAAVPLTLSIVGVNVGQIVIPDAPYITSGTTIEDIFIPQDLVGNSVTATPMLVDFVSIDGLLVGQPITGGGIPSVFPLLTVIKNIYEAKTIAFATGDINLVSDTFTLTAHGLANGNIVKFTSTGTLPTPLVAGTPYYVINATLNSFQLSTSFGGGVLDITVTGSGSVVRSNQIEMTDNSTATLVGAVFSFSVGAIMNKGAGASATSRTVSVQNGTSGIQALDTITIAGITYTAYTNEDFSGSNRRFKVYAHGSPAQNIADTAQSLIRVINRQTSASGTPDIYAYYGSDVGSLPGIINFIARNVNTGSFGVYASSTAAGAAYTPNIPDSTLPTLISSTNDELKNGLSYSKTDLPESVPLGYNFPIGSTKEVIIRIVALRDSLFVLKNDGIFRITGNGPTSFSSVMFDNTIKLAAPESAVSLSNTIFCLSTEGVVSISDSNVQIMSRPIENLILDAFKASQTKVRSLSYGVAYTSDRKYILFTISSPTDTNPTQAFVYNAYTNTWTTWKMTRTCGVVSPQEDLLYFGRPDSNTFKVERKTRTYTDYMDDSFEVDIIGVTGVITAGSNTITLVLPSTSSVSIGQTISGTGIPNGTTVTSIQNTFTLVMSQVALISATVSLVFDENQIIRLSDLSGISIGDVLYQNSGRFSIITDIDTAANTVITRIPINSWTLGPTTILTGIESIIQYAPQTCNAPAAIKQVTEFIGLFQVPLFDTITVSFESDISGGFESINLKGQIGGLLWGLYPWGQVIWGGVPKPIPLRTYVPRSKQRNTQLNVAITHKEAYAFYRLSGIELYHNAGLQRVRR